MSTTEIAIPATGDITQWTPQESALMEFAGLTWVENDKRYYAPRAVVEAFGNAVRRTGLDPTAKQIYAVQIKGKWSVLVGIDGMRVIAQRTGEYLGQTPIQWTADGTNWVDVWLSKEKPLAARIGVRRKGFAEPLMQVVSWAEFGQPKRFNGDNWDVRPAHMLGIRAESHALRRAFPADLSGLYTPEDMDGDAVPGAYEPAEDWIATVRKTDDKKDLADVVARINEAGEMTGDLRTVILTHAGQLTKDSRPKPGELDKADPNYVAPEADR